jgi:hypothetical protein
MSTRERVETACVIVLGLAAGGPARGEDFWVGEGQAYQTIQQAINDQACGDGDVVWVVDRWEPPYSGDGFRDLDFLGKAITVRSASGDPANCRIDCGSTTHRFAHFSNDETSESMLSGFTVRHGRATDSSVPGGLSGGAILCEGSSPTILDCVFDANRSDSSSSDDGGGAIACLSQSHPILANCGFTLNDSPNGPGGAIFCAGGSSPVIQNCTLHDNDAAPTAGPLLFMAAAP